MKKVQLGTVIHSLNTGLNPRKFFQLNTPDAEFYYVTIKEMVDGKIVYNENTDRLNENALQLCNRRSNLEKGDVLFSGTGTIGKTVVLTETPTTWNIKEGVYTIKPKQDLLNSNYLSYVLSSESIKNNYMTNVAGGTVKSLKMADLEKTEIPLPPLPEQQKIVAELDTIQSAIDSKKQQLALLDEAVKSRFIEMFGNPQCISNNWKVNPLSDYCIVNPKKSELGPIPDDYELSFIPMQSVSENGDVDTSSIKHYKDVKTGFTYFRENDVLFAKITPCMENGKGGVARKLKNQIGFGSTEFHVLRPIETISNSEWIYRLTTFKTFRKDAENNMTGSAGQRRTPKEFFDKYKVGLPPIELQNDFATFVQQIDKSKFVIKQQIVDLQELLNSKMQEYFS